jgi:Protein of unknown function (DUF3500)
MMKQPTTPTRRTVAAVVCATLACALTGSMAYAATTKKKTTTTKKSTTQKKPTTKGTPKATVATVAPVSTGPSATTTSANGTDTTPAIVDATNAFVATLTADQRKAVLFDFTNTAQRQGWSNLPEGLFKRSGVMWGKLSDQSRATWLTVMKTTLSQEGYDRVIAEWDGDEALAKTDGGGGRLQFGKQYYWIAILGTPSTTTPWQWQWGGHHVTVNATVVGTEVSLTPSFLGVQPATFTDATGKTIRPLGDIEEEAFALVNSLDSAAKKKAVIGTQIIDLVVGPGADGRKVANEGVNGSELTTEQKVALLKLAAHYGGLVNDEDAAGRVADIQKNLDQTYFAWSGPTTKGSGTYFRISGPTIVVEYSGQSMGGSTSQHVHGIYRDPTNDYGAKLGAGLK